MVRVFLTLVSDWGFDPYSEYRTVLKLVANIYLLMGLLNMKDYIITWLTPINILKKIILNFYNRF